MKVLKNGNNKDVHVLLKFNKMIKINDNYRKNKPVTKQEASQYKTEKQWKLLRNQSSVFNFTDEEIEKAKESGGYLGEKAGVRCYVK